MEYTFARDYLNRRGIEVHRGGKRILTPVGKHKFELPTKNTTGFWTGDSDEIERNITKITVMGELNDIGYSIASFDVAKKYKSNQRKIYKIAKSGLDGKYVRQIPQAHYVLYDVANRELRLVGPNAGPNGFSVNWTKMKRKIQGKQHKVGSIFDVIKKRESIIDSYQKGLNNAVSREFINIPEIPFMVSDANEIVCIPQTRDEPKIGIWGTTGNGKSFLTHSILSRAFWKPNWDVHVAILNDKQKETGGWALPNDEMALELSKLNELPRPLPTVHLLPHTNDSGTAIHKSAGTGFDISLPFDEVILNPHRYFEDLGRSGKFFRVKQKELLECETIDEMRELLKGEPGVPPPPPKSIQKILAILDDLKEKDIIDKWNGVPSKWGVDLGGFKKEYNPFTACIVAGVVPVLDTSNLLKKGYFPQYFQHFANDIYDKHQNDEYFKKNKIRTWVVTDEILSLAEIGDDNDAAESLETIQTQGRFHRIGSIIATQNYSRVQKRIRTNCNYIISFATPEGSQIASDYSMTRTEGKRIKKLNKFECIAYTYDKFVVYDMDGNRDEIKGPIFGKAIPPLSKHEAPI